MSSKGRWLQALRFAKLDGQMNREKQKKEKNNSQIFGSYKRK